MSVDPPAVLVVPITTTEWREGDRAHLLCSASGGRPADFSYAYKCATPEQCTDLQTPAALCPIH